MNRPRISVVIPCYNLGRYLDEAVASCLEQTFRDLEILVVNDGSTDSETTTLLADYRRPCTRVISTPNRGLAQARNLGWRETSGEYVCFLDADDHLHRRYFEKAVRALDADPDATFASCWIEAFGEESWIFRPERCDLATLLADCTVATPALVRRQALLAVGGFDEAMPEQGDEDWELWINLAVHGFTGTILPEVLFSYRRRSGSMVERCYYGDAHLTLMDYLFRKFAPHYREHLEEVLAYKEREANQLDADRQRLAHHLEENLLPALAARRAGVIEIRRETGEEEAAAALAGKSSPAAAGLTTQEEVPATRSRPSPVIYWLRTQWSRLARERGGMLGRPQLERLMAQERVLLELRRATKAMDGRRCAIEAELRGLDEEIAGLRNPGQPSAP